MAWMGQKLLSDSAGRSGVFEVLWCFYSLELMAHRLTLGTLQNPRGAVVAVGLGGIGV